jgi:hypothetical protein
MEDKDEDELAMAIVGGRTAAALAISKVLAGTWPVQNPINLESTSLLISTFRILGADARVVFREALISLLDEHADSRTPTWNADDLSTLMYVAREVSLAQRLQGQARDALRAILAEATKRGDVEVEGLALKYLASEVLVPSIEVWRSIHEATQRRHPYACFMGMAQVDLETALLWLDTLNDPEARELALAYGVPALIDLVGVRAVKRSVSRAAADATPEFVAAVIDAVADALDIPPDRRGAFSREILATGSPDTADHGPLIESEVLDTFDDELRDLAHQWDRPTVGPDAYPVVIANVMSGEHNVAA